MKFSNRSGFTIIEVLIVLCIAGLIMVLVFLVVPQARATERDHEAKRFVGYAYEQIDQYHNDTAGYPDTQAEKCVFMTQYLQDYVGSTAPCFYDSSRECVYAQGAIYDVCYHDADSSPHDYLGPVGEVSIQSGHICIPNTGFGDPIDTSPGGDTSLKYFAIWTRLERVRMVCLSSR